MGKVRVDEGAPEETTSPSRPDALLSSRAAYSGRRGCVSVVIGFLLVLVGIPMLVCPGPGVATIGTGIGLIAVGLGLRREAKR